MFSLRTKKRRTQGLPGSPQADPKPLQNQNQPIQVRSPETTNDFGEGLMGASLRTTGKGRFEKFKENYSSPSSWFTFAASGRSPRRRQGAEPPAHRPGSAACRNMLRISSPSSFTAVQSPLDIRRESLATSDHWQCQDQGDSNTFHPDTPLCESPLGDELDIRTTVDALIQDIAFEHTRCSDDFVVAETAYKESSRVITQLAQHLHDTYQDDLLETLRKYLLMASAKAGNTGIINSGLDASERPARSLIDERFKVLLRMLGQMPQSKSYY